MHEKTILGREIEKASNNAMAVVRAGAIEALREILKNPENLRIMQYTISPPIKVELVTNQGIRITIEDPPR